MLLDDERKRSDAVTVLTAGAQLAARTGRLQGTLDYQLSGSAHARESQENQVSQSLRAGMNATLIDRFLFLDASANISQQSVSAFGVQSTDLSVAERNRAEVRSYSATPSIRGQFSTFAAYDIRWTHTRRSSSAGELGDSGNDNASAVLRSTGSRPLGWSLSLSRENSDFDAGRQATSDQARAMLELTPQPDLRATVSGGWERSDLVGPTKASHTLWGIGLFWTPTERTRLSAQKENRYFGNTHSLSFEHRFRRSIWRFSSTKSVQTQEPTFVHAGTVALFDLLFANLATTITDPVDRRAAVMAELARQGRSPTETVTLGFLQSALTLSERQEFSVAWLGLRTNLSLSLSRSDTRRLDETAGVEDDFSRSGRVRQSYAALTVGHRLGRSDNLNLTLSGQRTRGSESSQRTDLRSVTLNWTTRLGPRSDLSVGARHVEFDSSTNPYRENAAHAALGIRF